MLEGTQQYKRERGTYKIIAMPWSRILVGQAVRSRRNIVLVVLASCITCNSGLLVYLKYIGQVMLDGFKGDKCLGRGGCLASCQMVGTLVRVGPKQTVFNPFPRRHLEPSPSECGR